MRLHKPLMQSEINIMQRNPQGLVHDKLEIKVLSNSLMIY